MKSGEKEHKGCFAFMKQFLTSSPEVANPRYEKSPKKTQRSQQKEESEVELEADMSPAVFRKMRDTIKKRNTHLSGVSQSEKPTSNVFNTFRRLRRNTNKSLVDEEEEEDDPLKPATSQKYVPARISQSKSTKRGSRTPKDNTVADELEDDSYSRTKVDNLRGSKISIVRVDSIEEISIPDTSSEASTVDNDEIFRESQRLNDHFLEDMLSIQY